MTNILTREQIHELLDAVLDITDGGIGWNEYPYVTFEVSNLGFPISVITKDHGFRASSGCDLYERITPNAVNPCKQFEDALKYLKELKKSTSHMPGKA